MWNKLSKENLVLLIVDFQKSFFNILDKKIVDQVRDNLVLLIRMFKEMGIPMIGTEHYLSGLGPTDKKVLDEWGGIPFIDKITFSCYGNDEFKRELSKINKKVVIVTGLETQICVLQTVLDLLDQNFEVIVLKDAVLSSTTLKWENGLDLMKNAGAHILNTETLIFYLLKRADSPEFKFLVKQLKEMQ